MGKSNSTLIACYIKKNKNKNKKTKTCLFPLKMLGKKLGK